MTMKRIDFNILFLILTDFITPHNECIKKRDIYKVGFITKNFFASKI